MRGGVIAAAGFGLGMSAGMMAAATVAFTFVAFRDSPSVAVLVFSIGGALSYWAVQILRSLRRANERDVKSARAYAVLMTVFNLPLVPYIIGAIWIASAWLLAWTIHGMYRDREGVAVPWALREKPRRIPPH